MAGFPEVQLARKFTGFVLGLSLLTAALMPDPAAAQYKGTIRDVACTLRLTDYTAPMQRFVVTEVLEIEFDYPDASKEIFWRGEMRNRVRHDFFRAVKEQQPELGPFPDSGYVDCTFYSRPDWAAQHVREMKTRPGYIAAKWDGKPLTAPLKPAMAHTKPTKPTVAPVKAKQPELFLVVRSADEWSATKDASAADLAKANASYQQQRARQDAEYARVARENADRQAAYKAQVAKQQADYKAMIASREAETARIRAEWAEQAARCKAGDKKACVSKASQR
mgnify:CR=1 FL=1